MIDTVHPLHDAERMRRADADLLSLAFIDSRNRTLRWLALFEGAPAARQPVEDDGLSPALWLAGHAGWYQERWIARNLQRARGAAADVQRAPMASIDPEADRCWDPRAHTPAERWHLPVPDHATTRHYLAETLETTGELLAGAGEDDDALHWFRRALFHEDKLVESFAVLAQALEVPAAAALAGPAPVRSLREPMVFGAQRFWLGSTPGGHVPAPEQWAHEEAVPEFEIDAQAVSWGQYAEFVADGGYDDADLWRPEGWAWAERVQRRCPRDVEQLRHGVLLRRFGPLQRVPATQPALHVSWYEADAWCRWANRRLPTEVEWELAAVQGRSRGFVWGDVAEWVAGRARAWPGGAEVPFGLQVQRGVPWLAPHRLAHPRARRFVAAQRDEGFCGFRSCAL